MQFLIGDIGGTNLRLAVSDGEKIIRDNVYSTTKFELLEDAIADFLGQQKVDKCCLAIAGPVTVHDGYETVVITNQSHQTEYNSKTLSQKVNFPCKFINDFAAIGFYLIKDKNEKMFMNLNNCQPFFTNNPILYIGAGTGLGVGYVCQKQVFSCEGGHSRFSVENEFEFEFAQFYKKLVSSPYHLSNDRVISGTGIQMLVKFCLTKTIQQITSGISQVKETFSSLFNDTELQQNVNDLFREEEFSSDIAAVVSIQALQNDSSTKSKFCLLIMAIFFHWYGRFVGDMTVSFCPQHVYLVGGVIQKNIKLLDTEIKNIFIRSIHQKGRLSDVPTNTPLSIIIDEQVGYHGSVQASKLLL